MPISVNQALSASLRSAPSAPSGAAPHLLMVGATGALGNAVLQRLVGRQRHAHTRVLTTLPMNHSMRDVSTLQVTGDCTTWPTLKAASAIDTAIVMFDPPRMFYERERALFTPTPAQLPALGAWLRRSGVRTLAVVLPHAQGTLPQALQRGLASLDEQALAALGFERLLIVRTAQKPAAMRSGHALTALAAWMLGIFNFMVPASEQPVRASKVAHLVDVALQHLPLGTWVAAPELVWQASQGNAQHTQAVVAAWLGAG
jgi:hypothetical protein